MTARRRRALPVRLILLLALICAYAGAVPPGRPVLAAALQGTIVPSASWGWTEGEFSVSDDGAAQYRLPLWTPKGRGDLRPELALTYHSRAGNGLLGVGWSLAGVSSRVAPCARTFAQDGVREGVGFTGADALCLDGNRLRPVGPATPTQREYRTERETFSRVIGYGPAGEVPDHFRVWTKDGKILTYGEQAGARLRAFRLKAGPSVSDPSLVRASTTRVTAAWMLHRIEDRTGNAIDIEWSGTEGGEADLWYAELRPEAIRYAPNRSVAFTYEPRDDPIDEFERGIHTRTSSRLSRIEMFAGPTDGESERVRDYRLGYHDDGSITGRSLLSDVVECDGPGVCLPPLEFTWSPGSFDFDDVESNVTDAGIQSSSGGRVDSGDVNGDGKDDLIYPSVDNRWMRRYSSGNGFFEGPHQMLAGIAATVRQDVRPIDFDRDGDLDVLAQIVDPNCECSEITEYYLHETDGSAYTRYEPDVDEGHISFFAPARRDSAYFVDLDGNGLPDYATPRAEVTRPKWRYKLNTGEAGADRFGPMVHTDHSLGFIFGPTNEDAFVRVLDSDGDGRDEVLQLQDGASPARYETFGLDSAGEVAPKRESINLPVLDPFGIKTHLVDVNGDGLKDAVYPFDGLKVQLNSGNGFGPFIAGPADYQAPEGPFLPNTVDYNAGIRTLDFTNDGHEDVLIFHDGRPDGDADFRHGVQLYVWRDGGFSRVPLDREAVELVGFGYAATGVFDVNGDGAMDIYHLADGDPDFIKVLRRQGGVPDQLTGVSVDTLGERVRVDYTTLANRGVHQPGDCTGLVVCPVRGHSVVSRHLVANGATGATGDDALNTFFHRYQGARVDLTGGGWLGFAEHTVIDQRAGATTVTEFDNSTRRAGSPAVYPFAHQPETVTTTTTVDSDTVHRRRITNGRELRRLDVPGTYTVEHTSALELDQEQAPDGTGVTVLSVRSRETSYDTFGNAELTTSFNGIVRSVTERATYRNDESAWIIGRRTSLVTKACTDLEGLDCTTRETGYDYDGDGNLFETVVEPNRSELRLRTELGRDEFGNVTSVERSDAEGHLRTESTSYDDGLHPATFTNALLHTSTVDVDSGLGVPLTTTDPNGVPTAMDYDGFGRLRETRQAGGGFQRVDHIVFGAHFVQVTDAGGGGTLTQLDAFARPEVTSTRAFGGGWAAVHHRYDALGRVTSVSRPALSGEARRETSYEHDGLGRITRETEPDGVFIRHEYLGGEVHTYDGEGVHSYTVTGLDGYLRARFEDDPDSAGWLETEFSYGPFGELTRARAPDGSAQTMGYDVLGRRERLTDPSAGTTVSTYTAFGELASETDGTGGTTSYVHDELGRIRRTTSPDGVATNTWDTAPRGIGKLTNARSTDGIGINYRYDTFGRPSTTTWNIEDTQYEVAYGYDGVGRQASLTYPEIPGVTGRFKIDYVYNPHGYLLRVQDAAAGTPYWQAEDRDAAGQLTAERLGNGVIGTRTYQPATGLVDTITTTGPGDIGVLGRIAYGYDDNRNVTVRHDTVNHRWENYDHDELNRLDRWFTIASGPGQPVIDATYAYDEVGNLTRETFQHQGEEERVVTYGYGENGARRHALTSRNATTYGYDGAGRQIAGPNRTVEYNADGLPRSITWGIGQGVPKRTDFGYDADGVRVLKRDPAQTVVSLPGVFQRRDPAGTGGAEIHNIHYIVVDGQPVAQVNRVQAATGGPVIQTQVWYPHTDQQGSLTLLTGPTGRPVGEDGTLLRELFYDPYGQRVDADYDPRGNGRHGVRLGYTGHEHDDEFGLMDMKGRVYDPMARRFLTPDPVVADPLSSQSHNRYVYVEDNPTTLTDPSGFSPFGNDGCGFFGMGSDPSCGQPDETAGVEEWREYADQMARQAGDEASTPKSDDTGDTAPVYAEGEVIVVIGTVDPPAEFEPVDPNNFIIGSSGVRLAADFPRDFYYNHVAQQVADAGHYKLAEIAEAGHGCTFCHVVKSYDTWAEADADIDLLHYNQMAVRLGLARSAAASLVFRNVRGANGPKPIVIGENMQRVRQYAAKVGGHAYRPWRTPTFNAELSLARNGRMIKDAMRQGRTIIDIGPDFARRAAGRAPSPFYNLERQLTKGYTGYRKVFVRDSRLSGGVPGLDQ